MDWRTGVEQALEEFRHHRLRTALTLLGMIFGVGAVISMLAIGEGAEREALRLIEALGLRNVIVEAIAQPQERLAEIREDSLGLTRRDLEIALETLPQVGRSAALKRINVFTLFSDQGRSDAEVFGISPSYLPMTGLELSIGRALLEDDERRYATVCVLGAQAARDLFGTGDPLGRHVKVNHVWLTVVGVLAERSLREAEFEGVPLASPQNRIYVPLSTALRRFRFKQMEDELDAFHLEVSEQSSIASVAATLSRLMKTRHRNVDDYRLIVPEQLLDQHRQTQRVFDIVMATIAGISLLVGGIGIMNIMLANVLERTREIGIRRAMGARQSDIRRQFMIEATTIAVIGGLVGIGLGFALAWAIALYSGWPFAWSVRAPLIAVSVCAFVGLVFGIYPAHKAARLDPIEALSR
ncbi:MAG: ABC transporter permease [Acidobacteriota bacterium]|nr:MAG: ABC transporter permease [Acidobacteriota bacterium]